MFRTWLKENNVDKFDFSGEILPQAILMYHSKLPAFSAIGGMLLGLFIIFA
jgi:hypothetical protein